MTRVFFQAEDGIRDLVRSRGLGDVYKRQLQIEHHDLNQVIDHLMLNPPPDDLLVRRLKKRKPVSYTHLTLPTSDLV